MIPEAGVHRGGDKYRASGAKCVGQHGCSEVIGDAMGQLVECVEGAGRHQHGTEWKHVEWRLFVAADPVDAGLPKQLVGRNDLSDIRRGDSVCPPARRDRAADQLADPPAYAGGGDKDEEGGLVVHTWLTDDRLPAKLPGTVLKPCI